jgi:hypothetical protein
MSHYICECEDFPCCGHDRSDRYTTKAGRDAEVRRLVRNAISEEE